MAADAGTYRNKNRHIVLEKAAVTHMDTYAGTDRGTDTDKKHDFR